jgi:hypothetical protein
VFYVFYVLRMNPGLTYCLLWLFRNRDDLQHHDQLSQKLGGLVSRTTTGICLVCTYRTAQSYNTLRASIVAPITELPHGPLLRLETFAGVSYEQAMQALPLSASFHRIELQPIAHASGMKLVAKVLTDAGLSTVEPATLAKVYELSAGSPLYATELAKSLAERYVSREHCGATQEGACSLQLDGFMSNMRTSRIEEVVHYRFDKLTEQSQLVLKMAAVAAVNGSHFTLGMLTYVLDSTDPHESSKFQQVRVVCYPLTGCSWSVLCSVVWRTVCTVIDATHAKDAVIMRAELISCSVLTTQLTRCATYSVSR